MITGLALGLQYGISTEKPAVVGNSASDDRVRSMDQRRNRPVVILWETKAPNMSEAPNMHSDRHSLRTTLQRIFRRREQKRQRASRRFEVMESRILLAADFHAALPEIPAIELHGEYGEIESVLPIAEGEGAIIAEGEAVQDLVAFAKALADSGTRFYGAAWDLASTAQKELFEDGANFLPFIEVTNLDNPVTLNSAGDGTDTTLNPSGVAINSFPTWEFSDGSRLEGQQTLATLAQRSGVAIPSSDLPFIAPIDDGDKSSSDVDADGDEIVTVLDGSPLHITLDGYDPGGGALTYTVTSSDPNVVTPTLLQNNRSMVIDVDGWGKMNLQLFEQRAPRPTSRLIELAEAGDYAGVPFHRIVDGFVIQGGDITNGNGTGGSSLGDFDDQFDVDLQHNRTGILSYAKSADDTNDSQFFITEVATRSLDGNHSVAGILVEGDNVREAISNNSTSNPRDVTINSVDIITDTENAVVMLKAAPGSTGTATITVTATDVDGNEFSREFTVNVEADTINTLPWLGEVSEIKVPVNQSTAFQFPVVDVEGDAVQFGVVAPTNFTITVPNGNVTSFADITITPAAGFVGQETVTFYVADAGLNLSGTTITNGILQSNSTLFDVQSLIVEAEASNTGTVTGTVFADANRDGVLDAGEAGLGGFVIFSDTNGNGVNDPGEITTTTASDGTYSLLLPTGPQSIRQETVGDFLVTTSNPVSVTVQDGQTTTDVLFGNFDVLAPTSIDLAAVADSGNDSDNITNFNNSAVDRALQFQIAGVVDGATVRVFADGVLIGQGTANGGATITADGTTSLTDGVHSIVATQEINGVQGPASAAVSITIDTVAPGAFTSSAPTSAIVDQDISYNAQSVDEGNGITYSLANAPTGALIDATTGFLSWSPTAAQLETNNFTIVATDVAGNTTLQQLSVRVTNQPVLVASYTITAESNPDSAAITEAMVGDSFFLQVSVTDLSDNAGGTFAFYEDIAFDSQLAAGQNITYSPTFSDSLDGTIFAGEINEVGAVNFNTSGVGAGTFNIFTVEFTATRSGTLRLVGNSPDELPAHDILVLGQNAAVPFSDILFGEAELTITPAFGANDDIFNFDEGSVANSLDVLANDSSLNGETANLTITAVSSQTTGVSIATDGKSILYTPPADFNGEIMFDYTVTDGTDDLTATVTVQVHPLNDDPVAVNDAINIEAGTSANFLNVLANDTDIDNDQLRVESVGLLSGGGTISLASSGSGLNYSPATGFAGVETVTYTINDGNGATSQATVTLTVTGAGDDAFTVNEGSTNNSFDVLANDIGSGLTITSLGSTTSGGIVTIIDNGGRISYSRPGNDDFFGVDTFTYTATDSNNLVSTGTVVVTVNNINDAPTANDDTFSVSSGTSNNVVDVLVNDSNDPDPAGETLTITAVDDTNTIGSVSLVNGSLLYTPPTTFPATNLTTGTDTFIYTIDDGSGLTSQATATINVVEFVPSSLAGFVYVDSNNDGVRDAGEEALEGIAISLSGTTDIGSSVSLQTTTASDGAYSFASLAPGSYTISETQPTGERNGVPIVDGQDTIGSQGGAVSANDEFAITLAEGTDGTDNNFAELLGRALSGLVIRFNSDAGTVAERFGGLDLLLFNSSTTTDPGNEVGSTNSTAGIFQYAAVAPGAYNLLPPTPTFLLPNDANVVTASVTAEADSVDNEVAIRGREAAYISLRDISTAAPTEYVHVAVGADGQEWYSFGAGWEGFTDATFSQANGGADLRIEVVDSSGQTMATDIAMSDSRLRLLGQKNGLDLIQIMAGSSAFDLQLVTPANSESANSESANSESANSESANSESANSESANSEGANGEGPAIVAVDSAPTTTTPIAAQTAATVTTSSPTVFAEGEATSGESLDAQFSSVITSNLIPNEPTSSVATISQSTFFSPISQQTVSLTSTFSQPSFGEATTTESVSDATRSALLEEVAAEYGDPFRYGSSSGTEFVPLESNLEEAADEDHDLPEELLEQLAADLAAV
jgi:large repetitive protein